jgi:hypothetical protein
LRTVPNFDAASESVNTLKQFGASFSLDDYGSGASSFGNLKVLQVDYLKTGEYFVKNMRDVLDKTCRNPGNGCVVEANGRQRDSRAFLPPARIDKQSCSAPLALTRHLYGVQGPRAAHD